jgi:hypothetical protein
LLKPLCPIPLLQFYFGDEQPENTVLTKGLSGQDLRFPLQLWYSPSAMQNMSPINKAVQKMTHGLGSRVWCGSVVVLKFKGSRRTAYSNAGTRELPTLKAFFMAD